MVLLSFIFLLIFFIHFFKSVVERKLLESATVCICLVIPSTLLVFALKILQLCCLVHT